MCGRVAGRCTPARGAACDAHLRAPCAACAAQRADLRAVRAHRERERERERDVVYAASLAGSPSATISCREAHAAAHPRAARNPGMRRGCLRAPNARPTWSVSRTLDTNSDCCAWCGVSAPDGANTASAATTANPTVPANTTATGTHGVSAQAPPTTPSCTHDHPMVGATCASPLSNTRTHARTHTHTHTHTPCRTAAACGAAVSAVASVCGAKQSTTHAAHAAPTGGAVAAATAIAAAPATVPLTLAAADGADIADARVC